MLKHTALLAVFALSILACTTAQSLSAPAAPVSYTLGLNALAYAREGVVIDPNAFDIAITGNRASGTIVVHMRNPNTTCVAAPISGGTPICGKQTLDVTLTIGVTVGILRLQSLVNNLGPHNGGLVPWATVSGIWDLDDTIGCHVDYVNEIYSGYPFAVAKVDLNVLIFGKVTQRFVFPGGFFLGFNGFVGATAVAVVTGQATPYELITIFGPVTSDNTAVLQPARALSPYASGAAPVAPLYVGGTLSNVVIANGFLTATANVATLSGNMNVQGGTLVASYQKVNDYAPFRQCFTIDFGLLTDATATSTYLVEHLSFCTTA